MEAGDRGQLNTCEVASTDGYRAFQLRPFAIQSIDTMKRDNRRMRLNFCETSRCVWDENERKTRIS